MKKKAMAAVLMMSMVVGSSLTVCAAPETKADGTVFDAEYYAQMYPDVVAELGTSADAMYQHYVTFGKAEGRLAVSPDAAIPQPENNEFDAVFYAQMYPDVVAALGTDADVLYQHYVTFGKAEGRLANNGAAPLPAVTTPAAPQTANQLQIIGTQGVVGATYQLPSWGEYEELDGPGEDQMIVLTVNTAPDEDGYNNDMQRLAPYTTDGYEWRFMHYTTSGIYNGLGKWWPWSYWSYNVDNSKDWQSTEDGTEYDRKFTVTQDGVDYTECKVADMLYGGQIGEVNVLEGKYFLLPKGYRGNVYFTLYGSKLDGGEVVRDDDSAVTFVF